ncbi:MAG: hypothetical protein NTY76_00285 [Candidatus Omnitrophica bacterium]|nr:hypothetical protein [Candidatus Omnitrophota bacterium]
MARYNPMIKEELEKACGSDVVLRDVIESLLDIEFEGGQYKRKYHDLIDQVASEWGGKE